MSLNSENNLPDKDDNADETKKTSEAVLLCKQLASEMAEKMKAIDPNFDRSSRFVREIQGSFSAYDEFVKTKKICQKEVTDFFKPKAKSSAMEERESTENVSCAIEEFLDDDESLIAETSKENSMIDSEIGSRELNMEEILPNESTFQNAKLMLYEEEDELFYF